jgi:hypothetical protein
LHLPSLLEREWAWLLQEPCSQANFPDVVHEAAEMYALLVSVAQAHAFGDVA